MSQQVSSAEHRSIHFTHPERPLFFYRFTISACVTLWRQLQTRFIPCESSDQCTNVCSDSAVFFVLIPQMQVSTRKHVNSNVPKCHSNRCHLISSVHFYTRSNDHTWAMIGEIWRKIIRFSALSSQQTQYDTLFANEVQATTVTNMICIHNKTLSPIITVTAMISSATAKIFSYALVRWCWEFLYTLAFGFCTHAFTSWIH